MGVVCINCCAFDLNAAGRNAEVGLGVCGAVPYLPSNPLKSAHFVRECDKYARAASEFIQERVDYLSRQGYQRGAK